MLIICLISIPVGLLAGIVCTFYVLLGISVTCAIISYALFATLKGHLQQVKSTFAVKSIIGNTTMLRLGTSVFIVGSLIVNTTMWATYFIAQHFFK